jgi:hypothetical protein
VGSVLPYDLSRVSKSFQLLFVAVSTHEVDMPIRTEHLIRLTL